MNKEKILTKWKSIVDELKKNKKNPDAPMKARGKWYSYLAKKQYDESSEEEFFEDLDSVFDDIKILTIVWSKYLSSETPYASENELEGGRRRSRKTRRVHRRKTLRHVRRSLRRSTRRR
jgi:hypothetical protein